MFIGKENAELSPPPESPKRNPSPKTPPRSPACATQGTPTAGKYENFYFEGAHGKTVGLTPGKRNQVPLKGPQGRAHSYQRLQGEPGPIHYSTLQIPPSKQTLELREGQLWVELKNLHRRVNHDYDCEHKYEQGKGPGIERGHYSYTKKKIFYVKERLKELYRQYPTADEKAVLLKTLNAEIERGRLSNPFALKLIYNNVSYNMKESRKQLHLTAVRAEQLAVKRSKKQQPKEGVAPVSSLYAGMPMSEDSTRKRRKTESLYAGMPLSDGTIWQSTEQAPFVTPQYTAARAVSAEPPLRPRSLFSQEPKKAVAQPSMKLAP